MILDSYCEKTRERLLLRLDGEFLASDEHDRDEQHLQHCVDCADWWKDTRHILDMAGASARERAPIELIEAVKVEFARPLPRRDAPFRLRRLLAPIALAAAACLALFLLPKNQINNTVMEPTRVAAVTPAIQPNHTLGEPFGEGESAVSGLSWDDEELNNSLSRVNAETYILRAEADPSPDRGTELGRQLGTIDITLSRLAESIEEL